MPHCPHCERTYEAEDLVHHVSSGIHYVHCPRCEHLFGTYNEHGNR